MQTDKQLSNCFCLFNLLNLENESRCDVSNNSRENLVIHEQKNCNVYHPGFIAVKEFNQFPGNIIFCIFSQQEKS